MSKSFNLSVNWIGSDKKIWEKKKNFSNIDITLVVPTDKMFGEVKSLFLRIKKFIKYPTE